MPSTIDCTIETTVPRDDIAYSAAHFGFDSDIELDEEELLHLQRGSYRRFVALHRRVARPLLRRIHSC